MDQYQLVCVILNQQPVLDGTSNNRQELVEICAYFNPCHLRMIQR